MIRLGAALFNADHGRLADEVRRAETAGIDFLHFDVFDGGLVPDLGFPPRTLRALRPLTRLPFEVHLVSSDPSRHLAALAEAGADLVFLPAEGTPLLYEAIYAVRERGMRAGLCLALGTPLAALEPVLPLLDAVLLLGRVTGEGQRGRDFNDLLLGRLRATRALIDATGLPIDLQAAGGLETDSCVAAAGAGAASLPLGGALYREPDQVAYVAYLRARLEGPGGAPPLAEPAETRAAATPNSPPYRVLVASRSFGPHCPAAIERLRAAGCELIPNEWGRTSTEAELIARIGGVDALISGTEPVTAAVLAAADRLKVISKHGVGYENIDLDAARARGIVVAVAGGTIAESVADMALALILALARQIPQGHEAVRRGRWPRLVGIELRGKTLGIVGLGQIGKAVARRAVGFGLTIAAHDAVEDAAFARAWGVRYLPLDELLSSADIITLHSPLTPATHHLIDARALARMKPTAFLVNTARGELVDEGALAGALLGGRLAGAASDVFAQEPPKADHPLLQSDGFIAMPHSAGQTEDGLRRMGEVTAENALRVLVGEEPTFRIA